MEQKKYQNEKIERTEEKIIFIICKTKSFSEHKTMKIFDTRKIEKKL